MPQVAGGYLNIDASRAFGLNRRTDVTLSAADDGLLAFNATDGVTAHLSTVNERPRLLQIDVPAGGQFSYGVGDAADAGNRFAPNVFPTTAWLEVIGKLWVGGITTGICWWGVKLNEQESMKLDVIYNTSLGGTYRVGYYSAAGSYVTVNSGITPDPTYADEIDFMIWYHAASSTWLFEVYISGATALSVPLSSTRFWVLLFDPALPVANRELCVISAFIGANNTGSAAQAVAWEGARIIHRLQ